jgi:hypothetical protein
MANREGQTIQWPTEKGRQYNGQQRRTDNTMTNREGQTIQWLTEDRQYNDQQRRTDNTMTNRKKGANNDQQNTTQKTKD